MTSLALQVFEVVADSNYSGKMPLIHSKTVFPYSQFLTLATAMADSRPIHSSLCQVCSGYWRGVLLENKRAVVQPWGRGKPGVKQQVRNAFCLGFSAQHLHSCFRVWFPNALQQSWKESKTIMWHYFAFAVSQQLLENFKSTTETSSTWKNCGNRMHWLTLCGSVLELFPRHLLLEETGYWVRWSDPVASGWCTYH